MLRIYKRFSDKLKWENKDMETAISYMCTAVFNICNYFKIYKDSIKLNSIIT